MNSATGSEFNRKKDLVLLGWPFLLRRRRLRMPGKVAIMWLLKRARNQGVVMPKISDIEETPNPNAVKFILREPVSNGVARQYGSADQAENDSLAKSLFDVGHVVSVFYMDRMITVEKDEEGDWDELLPALAVPIRAAEAVSGSPAAAAAAAAGGSIAAVTSDDPRLLKINEILDERVRPALMGDGGYLEVLGLNDHTLSIRYQGACGSCPSSLTGTLMAIEGMLKQEVDPDLEVIAV